MLQTRSAASNDDRILKTFATNADEFPARVLNRIVDHRAIYLNFEGALTGERGTVRRIDEGGLVWLTPDYPHSLNLEFSLSGTKLNGSFRILHLGGETFLFEAIKNA